MIIVNQLAVSSAIDEKVDEKIAAIDRLAAAVPSLGSFSSLSVSNLIDATSVHVSSDTPIEAILARDLR